MSKAFDTVDHTILIDKLLKTNLSPTIKKFIANYIRGRKAQTVYNNIKSKKQNIKSGVPQGGVLSPSLFNLYLSDLPKAPSNVIIAAYADDLTPTSSHPIIQTATSQLQPYLNELTEWIDKNKLTLNPDKSTTTLFSPDPGETNTKITLTINNIIIPQIDHPKKLGLTFDKKLNYTEHINKTIVKAKSTINILKALSSKSWAQDKETLTTTFKTITRPILEYANSVWSPIISNSNIKKIQTVQYSALRIITGCTADTNTQHLHEETKILSVEEHLTLLASQFKQKTYDPSHPLHPLLMQPPTPRPMKQNIFNQDCIYTKEILEEPILSTDLMNACCKQIHTDFVQIHLANRKPNKLLNSVPPDTSTLTKKP